ncbi:hypothetical protein CK203_027912 [Vitis vinifera]|uniref:Uncharacterized protein n=1 Tax=Vitis vinifera TaxID=29760 RepID=A0A438J3U2_VITVI|nr:hypothetical protein CK203_027912 [Vitis vinifera]
MGFRLSPPCSAFAGVICSLDDSSPNPTLRVTSLILGTGLSDSPGLAGSLSASLSNLTQLTQLVLYAGLVTGPIPPSSETSSTSESSPSPTTRLYPPGIAHLDQLKVLILTSNMLSGELPKFPASQELFHIDVKRNKIWGQLPSSMPVSVRYLSVSENRMWGPINGLESLSELVYLDLSMNQFSVETLFLNNNRLIGRVPDEYVNSISRGDTKTLYLQHNYISDFPMQSGLALPDSVSLCLSYNCMVPPVGLRRVRPARAGSSHGRRTSARCTTMARPHRRGFGFIG